MGFISYHVPPPVLEAPHALRSSATTASEPIISVGGVSDFSHSFIKSVAVRLMLPGVRRFSAAGQLMSTALFAEGVDGEKEDAGKSRFLGDVSVCTNPMLTLLK